jgi:hypothetical protein
MRGRYNLEILLLIIATKSLNFTNGIINTVNDYYFYKKHKQWK